MFFLTDSEESSSQSGSVHLGNNQNQSTILAEGLNSLPVSNVQQLRIDSQLAARQQSPTSSTQVYQSSKVSQLHLQNRDQSKQTDSVTISHMQLNMVLSGDESKISKRLMCEAEVLNKLKEYNMCKESVNKQKIRIDENNQERFKRKNVLRQVDNKTQEANKESPTDINDSTVDNPVTMDVKMVMEMFKDLKSEIASSKIPEGATRLDNLEIQSDEQMQRIGELQQELCEYKMKTQILTGVVMRMDSMLQSHEHQIEMLEYNSMKKSVVLTGFNTEFKKQACLNELYNFFAEEMNVQVQIEDLFFLNKQSTSPMVITLATLEDKREIFRKLGEYQGTSK